jgi:hypothetical protein
MPQRTIAEALREGIRNVSIATSSPRGTKLGQWCFTGSKSGTTASVGIRR